MAFFIKTTEGLDRLNGVYIKPSTAEKTITANGTYSAEDDGADGYSAVTVNVVQPPEIVANGFFSLFNGYPRPAVTLDLTKAFEIVICFKTQLPGGNKYMLGDYSSELGSLLVVLFPDGRIQAILPYNNHSWQETISALIPAESLLNFNGTAQNYIKIERTSGGLFKISASADGVTYTEYDSVEIPSGVTNINSAASLIFGNSGSWAAAAVSAETFDLFNCCIKSENVLVWGREIK